MIWKVLDSKLHFNTFLISGILTLEEGPHLVRLNNNRIHPGGVKSIIGAGTGLGKAFAVTSSNQSYYKVCPTEGGHQDFAPQNDTEWDYFKYIQ